MQFLRGSSADHVCCVLLMFLHFVRYLTFLKLARKLWKLKSYGNALINAKVGYEVATFTYLFHSKKVMSDCNEICGNLDICFIPDGCSVVGGRPTC